MVACEHTARPYLYRTVTSQLLRGTHMFTFNARHQSRTDHTWCMWSHWKQLMRSRTVKCLFVHSLGLTYCSLFIGLIALCVRKPNKTITVQLIHHTKEKKCNVGIHWEVFWREWCLKVENYKGWGDHISHTVMASNLGRLLSTKYVYLTWYVSGWNVWRDKIA